VAGIRRSKLLVEREHGVFTAINPAPRCESLQGRGWGLTRDIIPIPGGFGKKRSVEGMPSSPWKSSRRMQRETGMGHPREMKSTLSR
jgi:hypothetical protein